uniref:Uncharacterized protein n=1 Tax=Papio anubis TaxID=9555 RepID=A0A8I5R9Z8_PAPAN
MHVIPALWEAKVGGSPEVRSSRLVWPTWGNPISTTKNKKISRPWWWVPVIPAIQEAEVEELLESRGRGCSAPRLCHCTSAWETVTLHLKKKKEMFEFISFTHNFNAFLKS